jgi:hypothetical protein
LRRIPLGYLPFPLDEISHATVVFPVVRHLTALIVRDIVEVTLAEFCSGYVHAWSYIDPSKQSEISRNTRQILSELARDRTGQELIRRAPGEPPRWFLYQNAEFRRRIRFFQGFLDRFIAKKLGEDQPSLPLDCSDLVHRSAL